MAKGEAGHLLSGHKAKAPFNLAAVLINVILPPFIFLAVVSPLSFSWHFNYPNGVWYCVLPFLVPGLFSIWMYRAAKKGDSRSDPVWFRFSAWAMCVAWASGALFGDQNYWTSLQEYYTTEAMKTYVNIDPAKISGTQLMDAGRIYFSNDAKLDVARGMSFTHYHTYCVAPVVSGDGNLETYDLWAVGRDCCTTADPTFQCGDTGDGMIRAGRRLVNDNEQLLNSKRGDEHLFYQLAVSQAEAAFNIKARHPVFIHWEKDPDKEVLLHFEVGYKFWILACGLHAALNTFAVIAYQLYLSKRR